MKVGVYFCKELDIQSIILRNNKISGQALDTVLVSESEFKNIVNVGKIWIKFIEEEKSIWNIIKKKRKSQQNSSWRHYPSIK
jgi:hypothetical protein